MTFIKFDKRGAKIYKNEPSITITRMGIFSIGKLAYEKYFTDRKYVILYYDPESKIIGLQPTNESTPEAHTIRVFPSGKAISFSAKPFLDFFGIEYASGSRTYVVNWNEKDGMVEIDLKMFKETRGHN